jgi:hypothetical protein
MELDFSICTAFFNDSIDRAQNLWNCIERQEGSWEWVVTDDFSEDNSVKNWLINLSNIDDRVRYVEQNKKMEFMKNPTPFANGEFVLHVDSDDILYDGYLDVCKEMFNRLPDVGMILCTANVCDQHGGYLRYQQHNFLNAVCLIGRCWRKSLDFSFDGILEDNFFTLCNDLFIVGMVSLKSKVLVIPRVFVKYRLFVKDDGDTKPFGERMDISEEQKQSHERNYHKFFDYFKSISNETIVAKDTHPFFSTIQSIALSLLPTHNFTNKKFNMIGFDFNQEEEELIKILYSDKEFNFSKEICTDCLNIIAPHWRGSINYSNVAIFSFASETNDLEWLRSQLGGYAFMNFCGTNWVYSLG